MIIKISDSLVFSDYICGHNHYRFLLPSHNFFVGFQVNNIGIYEKDKCKAYWNLLRPFKDFPLIFTNIYELYRSIYGDQFIRFNELEDAKKCLDNLMIKMSKMKVFI